jgi:hypothetical protein
VRANAITNATSGKHMLTERQIDSYHWGGIELVDYQQPWLKDGNTEKKCLSITNSPW